MDAQHLLVERTGDITTITLNRPEKRNALALDVMIELTATFREVGDSDALGVVLAANGPVFSAGHNFGDMAGADLDDARRLFEVCTEMMDTVQSIPQPVIARSTRWRRRPVASSSPRATSPIAAESAAFAIPGGKGGLFCHTPLVAVSRNIGRKRALEMALTGDADRRRDGGRLGADQPGRARRRARRGRRRPHRPGDPRQRPVEVARQAGFYAQVGLDQPAAYDHAIEVMAAGGDARRRAGRLHRLPREAPPELHAATLTPARPIRRASAAERRRTHAATSSA